jgi:hypothetical protein
MSISSEGARFVRPAQLTRMPTDPSCASNRLARGPERRRVRHVTGDAQGLPSQALDLRRDLVDLRGPPRGRDHVGARLRETERQLASDPGGGSHHHGHLARKIQASMSHFPVSFQCANYS